MSSFTTFEVDLVGPTITLLEINDGAAETASETVDVVITTAATDATDVIFYGDVPGAALEGDAVPTPFLGSGVVHSVNVTPGDLVKTIKAKLFDDVGNDGPEASDSIILNSSVPTPNTTSVSGPVTPGGARKMSQKTGHNQRTINWTLSENWDEFEVRLVPTSGSDRTAGTVIPTDGGSTNTSGGAGAANTPMSTVVNTNDILSIQAGSGQRVVKIFVRQGAVWSSI